MSKNPKKRNAPMEFARYPLIGGPLDGREVDFMTPLYRTSSGAIYVFDTASRSYHEVEEEPTS